ncbi:MAG: hypothetical protein ACRDA3_12590 [Peptostreptococcaceae bacterium]
MSFIDKVKKNYKKAKATTKSYIRKAKDTVEFTKDSVNTIKEAKKLYDQVNGKNKYSNINQDMGRNTRKYNSQKENNTEQVIDVDFEEI